MITGLGFAEPILQSNESPGCAGTLFEDDDLSNRFTKNTDADIVFSTFVTRP